uniref:Uncharacterized protein n=1 Tax=uncultured beta proteobacterium HF0130_04F21 TaxID=710819 RepID=E0XSU3_9PROT|nr:hypothetical protein [uncultured beta proteobacterium HF0130_04F21]
MPDDNCEVEPHFPIPNRTVKRLCADDSNHSIVKVGNRQAYHFVMLISSVIKFFRN